MWTFGTLSLEGVFMLGNYCIFAFFIGLMQVNSSDVVESSVFIIIQ